jgi:hypothetical protein
MADTTIRLLASGAAVADSDLFITRQGADTVDKSVTGSQLKAYMGSGVTKGTAVIDFGAFPGANEATVAVTGQGTIGTGNVATASIRRATTADHSVNDHDYAALLLSLACAVPTAATGFDIVARCAEKMQGTFNINWQWA